MKKLDKFVLKAFLGPFIAILMVVIFILMMQFLWLYIDELVGKGLGIKVILEFLFWGSCTILPMALPLSTLLASMMVIGQMGENKELMAIKSAGISFARMMSPLFVVSVIISVGTFFVCNNLVPQAYDEIYTLRDDIGKTKEEIKIPSGTFYEGIEGYILRIDDQTADGMMHGVMVYDHTNRKGNTSITIADSSVMKMSRNKDYLLFTLFHGSNYQETNTKRYRDTTLQLQRIDFERQELIISLKNYAFEKSDSSRFGDQAKSMNLSQLIVVKDSLEKRLDDALVEHHRRYIHSGAFSHRHQLDTAWINLTPRQTYSHPEFMQWSSTGQAISAYEDAIESATHLSEDLMSFNNDIYDSHFYLRRMSIELLKKFAQALACLILFFVGAPLGALIKKGGLGTSAIVSVLFFVLYWVVDISGTKLARDGAASPLIGVFISSLVLIPIGAFLTWKAINDAGLFEGDSMKKTLQKVINRIYRKIRPVRIVFMGTPEFAVASLDALVRRNYKVVGVVTAADKPSGRGLQVSESAVKKYAVEHNIPVLQPLKLKNPEFLSALSALKADLFVVVAFRMLPEEVWQMPRMGTFNLHAALLPQYRGAAPINWAVINGEKMTGVTTFMIDKDIDTGGIILRQECRIGPEDTAGDIHDRLMEIGAGLVVETVEGIVSDNVEMRVQRSFIQGSEVLKPAPKLTRETCRIDWSAASKDIYNLIRGLSPYPAAYTELEDAAGQRTQLKIYFATMSDIKAPCGAIVSDGRTYLAIGTSDGALLLKDVQLSGKKRMDIKSFLAGFRDPQSYKAC